MTSKTIKTALKEARDFIKNKEYKQAIEKCNEVIREDPKNYMGLVFMGAAYQETDRKEAATYLRRAKDCATDPTLALQGLANCADIEELPEIYRKLLKLVPDKAKEYHNKIVYISSEPKIWEECVSVLVNEVEIENCQERVDSAWECLSKVFIKNVNVPQKWNQLLKKALETVITNTNIENHIDMYKRYIKLLYNTGEISTCLEAAVSMFDIYPKEIYPLEWICKIYSENSNNSTIDFEKIFKNPINWYSDQLLSIDSNSSLGLLVRAINLYETQMYSQSRDLLEIIKSDLGNDKVVIKYLALCYTKLGAYGMAIAEFESMNISIREYALCLAHECADEANLAKAVSECETFLQDSQDLLTMCSLIRALFKLKEVSKAKSMLETLKSADEVSVATAIEAEFIGTPADAIALLSTQSFETFEIEFVKGIKYFEMTEFEKALMCLLKATRLKPYYSGCFFYLGLLYTKLHDINRAQKCFEKSIYLNPMNQHAITLLSSIYRKNKEWDLNYVLLQNSIKHFKKSKWPYLQLGLHNLSSEKFNEAIDSFRTALRMDITDILCWEGLADSYFQRGSYNSAMKVYQKIIELDPDNSYAKLQVGIVKLTLHIYSEAIDSFLEVLEIQPDYLPALKGVANAHYNYSVYLLTKCLFGRAKSHLQKATDYLQRVFLTGKRNMIWLWRLLANVFVAAGRMSPEIAFLNVSGKLAVQEEDVVKLEREELFEFAGRFYSCAIKLSPDDSHLWHDISLCYYYYAMTFSKDKTEHLNLAINTCKQSIKLDPSRWLNWNLLGVICTMKEINDLPLAQHSFIKALQIEKKSPSAWTNLGLLYLRHGDIKLANKAFGRAQQADTGFLNAWIGQAIIAENIGQADEAMDLFRHCTQLGFNTESAFGYGYWVCNILSNPESMKDSRCKYAIENMFAVPVALDSMTWYHSTMGEKSLAEPLSYLGFLNSLQCLNTAAIKAFELAVKKADVANKDKMLCNLGYSYLRNNQLQEAIKAFDEVAEASFKSYIGLALARFRASQYQDSYSVYNLALEWLANSDAEKSLILLAMSSMVYAAQGEVDTKNILLQCIGLKDPPIQALFSACALGILHKDNSLVEAVMEALKSHENDVKHCHHIALLTAQLHANNNQSKKGLNHLLSKVHSFPANPLLRRVLADYLLHIYRKSKKHMGPASKIAESTVVLELRNPRRTKEMSLNASKYLAVAGEAMKRVNKARSLKLAQRAIHLNPLCQEAWDVLVSCKS